MSRALLFLAALPLSAQIMAMLKPALTYGHNQAWTVTVVSTCPTEIPVSRAAILIEAPAILDLPNDIARASLLAAYGHKSIGVKLADAGATLASTGLTAAGVATGTRWQPIAAAGIGLGQLLAHLIWVPTDPSQFFGDLLPDTLTVPAMGGRTGYGVVAMKAVKHAKAIGPFIVARCAPLAP